MDTEVRRAREAWRSALQGVDELADQADARQPVDPDEWAEREAREFAARKAYYSLLRAAHGLPAPPGLDA